MNSLQVHGQHLYDGVHDLYDTDQVGGAGGEEAGGGIWVHQRDQEEDLIDVNDPIFYSDFPALPDFSCMSSSSSSSSSTPAPVKANTPSSSSSATSSSSAASWAVIKSEAEEEAERRNNNNNHLSHLSPHDPYTCYSYYDDKPGQTLSTASMSSTASMEGVHPHHQPQSQPSDQNQEDQGMQGVDCMDVMESFGYMDLLENNEFFDPTSIFHPEEENTTLLEELNYPQEEEEEKKQNNDNNSNNIFPQQEIVRDQQEEDMDMTRQGGGGGNNGGVLAPVSDDLAVVFLDWLKNNKETVSAEDLRKVKIKKSTIECAASRLGGGKEAMKQLLKLILEWVQTNHLQKRKLMIGNKELPSSSAPTGQTLTNNSLPNFQYQPDPAVLQNPNPNLNPGSAPPSNPSLNCGSNFSQPDHWASQPQQYATPETGLVPGYPPMGGFVADPYGHPSGYPSNPVNYNMLGSPQAQWGPGSGLGLGPNYGSFPENSLPPPPLNPSFTGYGGQYPYNHQTYLQGQGGGGVLGGGGCDNGLVKLGSSATKEARKKRMAKQRRFLSHHRGHHPNHQHLNQGLDPHARLGSEGCDGAPNSGQANPGNWVYWPPAAGDNSTSPALPGDVPMDRPGLPSQNFQRQQPGSDRKQGWKSEKNLKFLLQKVLKQSDVGNLGRIVLPKKEAETHLPELEARDGISIAMEDIGTSRVWNMRYRFWPNNKSRMYLLENTGDFVRTNELQEGDFIVIYSDMRCGKYLIRGVKVRQQQGAKLETTTKRPAKSQRNGHGNSPGATNINGIGTGSPAMI